MSRRSVLAVAVTAVALGWSQPLPAATATFSAGAGASPGLASHTLETSVLDCSGGLLSSGVKLTWSQVPSAITPDPYASPPNSKFRADGYESHRATGDGPSSLLTSPARTATSYTDNPGGLLTSYRYRILAKKEGWRGVASNAATASVTSVLLVVSISCSA